MEARPAPNSPTLIQVRTRFPEKNRIKLDVIHAVKLNFASIKIFQENESSQ